MMEAAKRKGNRLETDTELMDDTVCEVIVVAFMIGVEVWIASGGKRVVCVQGSQIPPLLNEPLKSGTVLRGHRNSVNTSPLCPHI